MCIAFLYGFKDGMNACCGAGPYGGLFTCGGTKAVAEYKLCEHASDFVWWDSFHPTEKIHEQIAQLLWSGPSTVVWPYTLQTLFSEDTAKLTIADIVDGSGHVGVSY
ncbi:hypothetical protein ACLOJK_025842 [Asimina triloba]